MKEVVFEWKGEEERDVGWVGDGECLKERSSVELRPLYGHTKLGSEVEGYAYLRLRPFSSLFRVVTIFAVLLLAPRLRPARALRPSTLFPFHPPRRFLTLFGRPFKLFFSKDNEAEEEAAA